MHLTASQKAKLLWTSAGLVPVMFILMESKELKLFITKIFS